MTPIYSISRFESAVCPIQRFTEHGSCPLAKAAADEGRALARKCVYTRARNLGQDGVLARVALLPVNRVSETRQAASAARWYHAEKTLAAFALLASAAVSGGFVPRQCAGSLSGGGSASPPPPTRLSARSRWPCSPTWKGISAPRPSSLTASCTYSPGTHPRWAAPFDPVSQIR